MALAPDRTGIGIRRHFTTEDVHPYDQVEWDRRDARIVNFKDGSVAFEQTDVEVPSSWSVNATNILAQKYFRGTPGSAEREWSLKQVADRVVDTIAQWGAQGGYFVDEAEAETFRAELKHLVVTQKAAFNSPVWFNIGVKGVPQQASACQPYGALVSTPDGMVPIGRLVETGAVGAKVFDAHGLTRVVAVKHNGRKPVLRIHTTEGQALDVTADHLVWRATGVDGGAFVEAGSLVRGDQLEWHRTMSWGEGEIGRDDIAEAALAGARPATLVPERLFTAPLPIVAAYLRSLFQAEGYVRMRERSAFVGLDVVSEDLVRGIQTLLSRFGIFARVRFTGDRGDGRVGCWSLTIRPLPDRVRFADEIGFIDERRADELAASLELAGIADRRTTRLEIDRVEAIGEADVYDIQTESGEYLSGNLRVHNCFILAVDDSMQSILNWYVEEGTIFKGGSGSGINLSRIRSSREPLAGGGTASGPVSFMRGADASAGTIKSGGKTRRAAKMVILDADHPDVEDFIWCKAVEERKARVLRDAGFDMDLDGKDSHSTQYQNANNSVRVTDEFMNAVLDDADWHMRAVSTGEILETVKARDLFRQIAQAAWECADPGMQFDTTINRWHTAANTGRINGSNPCSEYMHLDNSACNLASINLLKFLDGDDRFDVESFKAAVEVVFTAQEILVGRADYPTERIGETSRRFRQLGLGYANLGAMLMALGLPYDSDAGRAWAASITALMTGHAYAVSARTAARMGPFAGFTENREHMLNVLRMHSTEAAKVDEELVPHDLLGAAQQAWDEAVELGEAYGVRNSQASVLAPTGCLVGGTLVATDRGLVRLRTLGDPDGEQWQDLDVAVQTDHGQRRATKFYVNGLEPVVDITTRRGYRLRGTTQHRIKVVDENGTWAWRRFADLEPGDIVPLSTNQLIGERRTVRFPQRPDAYRTAENAIRVPRTLSPALAELIGYFMGGGSLHSGGIRLRVAAEDFDVTDHLTRLGKDLFGLEASVSDEGGYTEVAFHSVRLVEWWRACGFARHAPGEGHAGTGGHPHVPDAVLHTNDREVYAAFLRGLYEAEGTVTFGDPTWGTTCIELTHDVQTLLLALGFPTTRRFHTSGRGSRMAEVRLLDRSASGRWLRTVGFVSDRKRAGLEAADVGPAERHDRIPVNRALIDRVVPVNDPDHQVARIELNRHGAIPRRLATRLFERSADTELGQLLDFFYDTISTAELGDEELTYDISVPENVTYLANGFISHNTIGLLMDCDTTGIEPDLGLVKMKKLVGGGTMSIVNQTVPRALRRLGHTDDQIAEIVAYIDENKSIIGAPHLAPEHLPVFACSMGDNTIHYMGHVKMMGAVQPFISGAISKCVVGDTLLTTTDGLVRIGALHDGEAPDTFRPEIREVASLAGRQKTDAFYYGGVRQVREVVLRSGHRVTGTHNHRLLVAAAGGLEWRTLAEIRPGDHVAVEYGADMWSAMPARLDGIPSGSYGTGESIHLPAEMTDGLAFLLGAYAAAGRTDRAGGTVEITCPAPEVGERLVAAWREVFGIEAATIAATRAVAGVPAVTATSRAVVALLDHLGAGDVASARRIPDAVLVSPRSTVLAFLEGLALAVTVTSSGMAKWAISLDAPALLDDLQAVLTNLGVVHARVTRHDRQHGTDHDEVCASGRHAQHLVGLVPFLEPDKAATAARLAARRISDRHAGDTVPGLAPRELYELLPRGRTVRAAFAYLCDRRTTAVTRATLERVAGVPGVRLPMWLRQIVDADLHFSEVATAGDAGEREVFDLSVPVTHAFVGNGIVNHNTVNMPEEATVEDVEQLHVEAWRLGLKAVAIYRDNCKVAQPLSTAKKEEKVVAVATAADEVVQKVIETVIVREPTRDKLPRNRRSKTFEFRVADCKGFVTVGEYDDGRPGELFLRVSKQGSTLAGIMDAFAISISHGLQYGVPLRGFVETFINMRFEPAGMTDDPDIRFVTSLLDYIFRKLAVEYLTFEERAELGILTVGERTQPTLPGVEETAIETVTGHDVTADPPSLPSALTLLDDQGGVRPAAAPAAQPEVRHADAPYCMQCGVQMIRAGSCHACPSCGTTSGCS